MSASSRDDPPPNKSCCPPLASSPSCFNALARGLLLCATTTNAADTCNECSFVDVYGLDDASLSAQFPDDGHRRACSALILAYPVGLHDVAEFADRMNNYTCLEDWKEGEMNSNNLTTDSTTKEGGIFFCKQVLGGTCGTVAALHALANGTDMTSHSSEDCLLRRILYSAEGCASTPPTPSSRATTTCNAELSRLIFESDELRSLHYRAAAATSARPGEIGRRQGTHFVTFVQCQNNLIMLDGRRDGPLVVREDVCAGAGTNSRKGFIAAAAEEIRELIKAAESGQGGGAAAALCMSLLALVGSRRDYEEG